MCENKKLEELKKLIRTKHKTGVERLNEREACLERDRVGIVAGKTQSELKEKRKREFIEYNQNILNNLAVGIHRKELPKFAEFDLWKTKKAEFIAKTMPTSTPIKFNEKQDPTALGKLKIGETTPITVAKVLNKSSNIPEKPNEFNIFDPEISKQITQHYKEIKEKRKNIPKWTALMQRFTRKEKGAYEDELPNVSKAMVEPMYSSFSPDFIFTDPLTKTRKQTSIYKEENSSLNKTSVTRNPSKLDNSLLKRITDKKNATSGSEINAKKLSALGVKTNAFE